MKKVFLCVFLAAVLIIFGGCGETTVKTASSGDEKAAYISLVELLREELDETTKQLGDTAEKLSDAEKELEKLKKTYADEITSLKNSIETLKESAKEQKNEANELKNAFTYQKAGGEISITGYNGNYSTLVLPSEIDGLPVTEIADSVFAGNTALTSVTIPSGVKKLGWFAFSGCTSLTSVTLPASVESIGYDAFAYCMKLTLKCPSGSYAERYAASYGISCVPG